MIRIARRTAALLLLTTATAMAHDTWLLTTQPAVPVGARVRVAMTSAGRFPAPESAIALDRLVGPQSEVRLAGTLSPLRLAPSQVPRTTTFEHLMDREGVATIFAALKPRTLQLDSTTLQHYFDEVGASAAVREAWRATPTRSWRESYAKFMKTFVAVGRADGDSSWRDPVDHALEFVPLTNPTTLRAGDSLRVRLLLCGQPLADAPVVQEQTVTARTRTVRRVQTAADGTVTLPMDRAGAWLVKSTVIALRGQEPVCLTGEPDTWHSAFATLTVGVRALPVPAPPPRAGARAPRG